jgi:hypothetical protein
MRKLLLALPLVGSLLAGGVASANELVVRDHDAPGTRTVIERAPDVRRYEDAREYRRFEVAPHHRRWVPAHWVRVGWRFERVPGHWDRF